MHVNLGNNKEKLNEAHFPLSHPPSASNTIGYAHIPAESTGLLSLELLAGVHFKYICEMCKG